MLEDEEVLEVVVPVDEEPVDSLALSKTIWNEIKMENTSKTVWNLWGKKMF